MSALSDSILSCLRTINTFCSPFWNCNIRFANSKLEVCIIYLQKRAVSIADLIYKLLCCSIFTGFGPDSAKKAVPKVVNNHARTSSSCIIIHE